MIITEEIDPNHQHKAHKNMNLLMPIIKTLIVIAYSVPLLLLQALFLLIPFWKNKPVWIIPNFWHFLSCHLIGLKIIKIGEDIGKKNKNASIIYASNHISYLDILVHGRWLKGFFIAKSDIASWPVFGYMAKLQATFFVERRPTAIKEQKEQLTSFLTHGARLMFFPEGTTSNGWEVKAFKSSLFSAAISEDLILKKEILIQPVSLVYTHIDGKFITRKSSDIIAWYDDMSLVPHLWRLFQHGKLRCQIHFHTPIHISDLNMNRKEVAQYCETCIKKEVESTLPKQHENDVNTPDQPQIQQVP